MSTDITIHFALLAEQVVSPEESSCPRRPLGRLLDWTGNFERKLEYLDKAGVGTYWLYGFRGAEGTMRDIGLLKAAKAKLERLGKDVYVICEPLGHPGGEPPAGSPRRLGPPGQGWRYRINADGNPDWGTACLDEIVLRDLVAATTAFRDAGFKKVFFDDDLRMAFGHGRVRWGDTAGGCFCDACIAAFNQRNATRFIRADLREIVMNPEKSPDILEDWITFNCDKVTDFMKAVNLPGLQVGIMVMCMGSRNHGIDLAAIQRAVPDCLVRVGEGSFCDVHFDPPEAKAALIASLEMHKAIVKDVSRLYSENTVYPWPNLRPENMAKKLLIEVEHGLRNIMLMPPQLLDAPEYWEAIAGVLPEAKALASSAEVRMTVAAEETVYADRYSNNGACPLWCFNNTCIVRQGDDIFASGYERIPGASPMNDCRWALWQRTADGWQRRQADATGRTREPSPLACLPGGRLLLSANPTLLPPDAAGGGPARPEFLLFDSTAPTAQPEVLLPAWQGSPHFNQHSYRTLAMDAARGETILFQNADYSRSEWALRTASADWISGRLAWPAHVPTDMAPFGASHARVNYPVVALRNRAVHFCGAAAYDNWDRVRTPADLGLDGDPNAQGASGMAGRQRGNRFRRLLYAWTPAIGEKPFSDWLEIDNTFADGGWLFATDMHVDADGVVHLLWFHSPMLPTVRDRFYPDIKRVYRIEYATVRDGKVLTRRTLVEAGEGADPAIPTDLDQVGRTYLLDNGETILGDPIPTQRFHVTPDGRLLVVYYVSDGKALSENRILEIAPEGTPSAPRTIPLQHPLTQFFTATPRAGCAPSWTLDLLGHRRGGWRPAEGSGGREWDGTISYARVMLDEQDRGGVNHE